MLLGASRQCQALFRVFRAFRGPSRIREGALRGDWGRDPAVAAVRERARVAGVKRWIILIGLLASAWAGACGAAEPKKPMNESPKSPGTAPAAVERITIGGGCFWCIEAVFQRLEGVTKVVSGYAGGNTPNPTYDDICTGTTGHAEVIQLTFDPTRTRYEKLLEVFWAAHDPTTVLDKDTYVHGKRYPKGTAYQGNDVGSQYRSAIYYETEVQKAAALKSKEAAQKEFPKPIATEIAPLTRFYPAEDYHQNYYNLNKSRNPYCSSVITPKLQKLLKKGVIGEKVQASTDR